MSEEQNKAPRPQDEIDLVQLFAVIGNAIDKLVQGIKNLLDWILDLFLRFLLVIRKHFLKFVVVGVVFAAIGYYLDTSSNIYKASAFVAPKYNSTVQVFSNIETLDRLARSSDEEKKKELASILNISTEQAEQLVSFDIERGPSTENDNLMAYDSFIKKADSVTVGLVTFEQYIEQLNKYSASQYEVIVHSKDPALYSQIQKAFLDTVGKNPFILKKRQVELRNIEEKIKDAEKSLQKVDSLRNVYIDVLMSEANKGKNADPKAQGTSISFAESTVKTNELQLFQLENEYRDNIKKLNQEKLNSENIVELISGFQAIGMQNGSFFKRKMLLFPIIGEFFLIFILLGLGLNRFLSKFEAKIKQPK